MTRLWLVAAAALCLAGCSEKKVESQEAPMKVALAARAEAAEAREVAEKAVEAARAANEAAALAKSDADSANAIAMAVGRENERLSKQVSSQSDRIDYLEIRLSRIPRY